MSGSGVGPGRRCVSPRTVMAVSLNSGCMANAILIVGETQREFRVVKELLQLHSPVLKEKLSSSWNGDPGNSGVMNNGHPRSEKDEKVDKLPIFYLPEFEHQTFEKILEYIYKMEWIEPKSLKELPSILPLLCLARDLELHHLVRRMNEYLIHVITAAADSPLLYICPKAIFHICATTESDQLRDRILQLILKFFTELFQFPENYEELREEHLIGIFSHDNLTNPDELQLFDIVQQWGKARCGLRGVNKENLKKVIEHVLPHIQFNRIAQEDFKAKVESTDLLPPSMVAQTLLKYLKQDCKTTPSPDKTNHPSRRKYLSPLEKLPDELLCLVTSHLDQPELRLTRLVCRRLLDLIENYANLEMTLRIRHDKPNTLIFPLPPPKLSRLLPYRRVSISVEGFKEPVMECLCSLMENMRYSPSGLEVFLKIQHTSSLRNMLGSHTHGPPYDLLLAFLGRMNQYDGIGITLTLSENLPGIDNQGYDTIGRLLRLHSLTFSFQGEQPQLVGTAIDLTSRAPNLTRIKIDASDDRDPDDIEEFQSECLQLTQFLQCVNLQNVQLSCGLFPAVSDGSLPQSRLSSLKENGCTFDHVTCDSIPYPLLQTFGDTLKELSIGMNDIQLDQTSTLPKLPNLQVLRATSGPMWLFRNLSSVPNICLLDWARWRIGLTSYNHDLVPAPPIADKCNMDGEREHLKNLKVLKFLIHEDLDLDTLKRLARRNCPGVKTLIIPTSPQDDEEPGIHLLYEWFQELEEIRVHHENDHLLLWNLMGWREEDEELRWNAQILEIEDNMPNIGKLKNLRRLNVGLEDEYSLFEYMPWKKASMTVLTKGISQLPLLEEICFPPMLMKVAQIILGFLAFRMKGLKRVRLQLMDKYKTGSWRESISNELTLDGVKELQKIYGGAFKIIPQIIRPT